MKAQHWASEVGANDAVQWPVGLGGKGNDGVAAFVKQTPGAIGYVEYAFAKQNAMTYAMMQNKDGKFVTPDAKNFAAAAANAKWASAPGFYLLLLDQPGADAWPITGATFILVHTKQSDAGKGREVLDFFDWCYKNGDAAAGQLDYVPPPKGRSAKSWARSSGPTASRSTVEPGLAPLAGGACALAKAPRLMSDASFPAGPGARPARALVEPCSNVLRAPPLLAALGLIACW